MDNVDGHQLTGGHRLTGVHLLRVRYDECDSMGITYHARYLDWFVIGRTELLRDVGLPYAELERAGLLLPVLEARCRYLTSTRYDDWIKLETRLLGVGRTRVAFGYRVWRLPDGVAGESVSQDRVSSSAEARPAEPVLAAEGETSHAFIDARHRPIDVKKHFPDVWSKLEPLAHLLRDVKAE